MVHVICEVCGGTAWGGGDMSRIAYDICEICENKRKREHEDLESQWDNNDDD